MFLPLSMTIAPASKFIIVDHSLINLQGHHYECSVAVAEAAQRAGYNVSILANKQFLSVPCPR